MSSSSRALEVRTNWCSILFGHILWAFLALLCRTLRKKIYLANKEQQATIGQEQTIVSIWHNRVLTSCPVFIKLVNTSIPISMLTSASKDGAILSTVVSHYKMTTVRGSSHRRGVGGMKAMLDAMKSGCAMCVTPDGPRGPVYKAHRGAIKLASMSGVHITPMAISFSSYWRLKTWDGFIIPKPFSRLEMYWGSPIHVPRDLSAEQMEDFAQRLTSAMEYGAPDFEEFSRENKFL